MRYSWNEFILSIAELYIAERTETEISNRFAGAVLIGSGLVERVELDLTCSQFIQVYMPRIEIPFKGKIIVADFLALNFERLKPEKVKAIVKGTSLNFETKIIAYNGPFPGISVSEFSTEKEILIMPGTMGTKIV